MPLHFAITLSCPKLEPGISGSGGRRLIHQANSPADFASKFPKEASKEHDKQVCSVNTWLTRLLGGGVEKKGDASRKCENTETVSAHMCFSEMFVEAGNRDMCSL